jgi:hypothetical protein
MITVFNITTSALNEYIYALLSSTFSVHTMIFFSLVRPLDLEQLQQSSNGTRWVLV